MFPYRIIFQFIYYFRIAFFILILKILNIITFSHIIAIYISYCIYVHLTSKTLLYYTKNEKNEKILSMCPELSKPNFKPHFFLPFAFQQMYLSLANILILGKPKLKFREQKVKFIK